jgi:hypothetical protein
MTEGDQKVLAGGSAFAVGERTPQDKDFFQYRDVSLKASWRVLSFIVLTFFVLGRRGGGV